MPAARPSATGPTPNRVPLRRTDWAGWVSGAILAAGTIAVYRRTLSVPLLLDDHGSIADNLSIRRLWPIGAVFSPPHEAGVGGRPLLNLSFALNYAAGGPAVIGYHLVNLFIHLLAGWTLFALVRRTLQRPLLAERFGSAATPLALAVSAIWAWHPVQTESVTYLTQRAESLMGLFYLLTLYCFIRFAERASSFARTARASSFAEAAADRSEDKKAGRGGWAVLSVLACLFGMATKEVMVTAPLLVFLYDRTFVSGSFSGAWRRHWPVYVALAATWLPAGYLMSSLHYRGMGFGHGVAWWAYGAVECRAVVKYLRLAFWPHPLVFDYGIYAATPFSEIWPDALVLVALLALTVVAARRSPAIGFLACWFFLILAPASSIVPIVGEPMAESRLYLPLAGIAALAVLGIYVLAGRRSLPLFAVVAAALGLAAAHRNQAYASEQAIWSDTIAKNPTNPRAHANLGSALSKMPGRLNDAIAQYEEALRLKPDLAEAHYNLGNAWAKTPERLNDAIAEYEQALRLKPDFAAAHYNLGNAWSETPRRLNDAIAEYEQALRVDPDFAEAHFNLAIALLRKAAGRDEAKAHLEAVVQLQPENETARRILARIRVSQP